MSVSEPQRRDFDVGHHHTYRNLCVTPDDERRRIDVFLPCGFERDVPLPVVYMNDGHRVFEHIADRRMSWKAEQASLSLRENGQTAPIVVGVHPRDRSHEYLHVRELTSDLNLEKKGGGLEKYASYLTRVKSFIDLKYPTNPSPDATVVVGSSHGGLAAFYTGIRHPECFGLIGALSPSFWAGGSDLGELREAPLFKQLGGDLSASSSHSRIWIDWGMDHDLSFEGWFPLIHNLAFERWAATVAPKVAHILVDEYGHVPGQTLKAYADAYGTHEEESWARRLPWILSWLYQDH